MKVLVTGATGYIGLAVVKALVASGHSVTGVVRSSSSKADAVKQAGAEVLQADLSGLDEHVDTIASFDGAVHAGADYSDYERVDGLAVDALLAAQTKANARFFVIYTSGCLLLGNSPLDSIVTEDSKLDTPESLKWRAGHEQKVASASPQNAVVRPGFVWGGKGGNAAGWYAAGKGGKPVTVVGAGGVFPWVHVDDLARQFTVLANALSKKDVGGVYHLVDGLRSLHHKTIAAAFAKELGVSVEHSKLEDARNAMGAFADLLQLQQGLVSADKIKALGWEGPVHRSPVVEVRQWVADQQ